MIKSKFKFWVLIPILVLFLVTVLLYQIILNGFTIPGSENNLILYALISLLVYVWIWIFFGELRTKAIVVTIDEKILYLKNYLGIGVHKVFDLSEFDGFITCQLPSRGGTYEYLYLIKNGKKVKISEFYHRNYPELKQSITETLKFLGDQPFSMLTEIKEIFI